jgi:hypothetical protein
MVIFLLGIVGALTTLNSDFHENLHRDYVIVSCVIFSIGLALLRWRYTVYYNLYCGTEAMYREILRKSEKVTEKEASEALEAMREGKAFLHQYPYC